MMMKRDDRDNVDSNEGHLMQWIEDNLAVVVLWIGTIVSLAFYFGKRLTTL